MTDKNNYKVYIHIFPNEKVYIGITCQEDVNNRYCKGKAYNRYFTNAVKKYGWDNIIHKVLFDNLSKEDACKKEIELITLYKSNNPDYGYNLSSGGESGHAGLSPANKGKPSRFRGVPRTEEVKRKISNSLKGEKNPAYGKPRVVTNETRKKISKIHKGKKLSDETKKKLSLAHKGKKDSEEVRKRKVYQEKVNIIQKKQKERYLICSRVKNSLKNISRIGRFLEKEITNLLITKERYVSSIEKLM